MLNMHGHNDEILSAFHTMRKEQKALCKQLKNIFLKKKGRKKRGYDTFLMSPPIPTVIRKRGTTVIVFSRKR